MGGTSLSTQDTVAKSPRRYAAAFHSKIERFEDRGPEKESINLQYNITAYETTKLVETSPLKYTVQFRKPSSDKPPREHGLAATARDAVYDTDTGNQMSLSTRMANSPRQGGFNMMAERFAQRPNTTGAIDVMYDVNTGRKADVPTSVATSPYRYAGMQKGTPRGDVTRTVYAEYNPENHTMQRHMQESPRRYANVKHGMPHRDPSEGVSMLDLHYKTDRSKGSIAERALEPSRQSCVPFMNTPRRNNNFVSDAPDRLYDIDAGPAMSVSKRVQTSAMMYSGMTHSAREAPVRLPLSHHLSYDSEWFPVKPTVVCSVLTTPRRYSNIRSAQPRFRDDESGEGCHLQYKDDAYPKGEGSIQKRVKESPRKYFGAQSTSDRSMLSSANNPSVQLLYVPDYGKTKSVASAALASAVHYSAMKSAIPRFKTEKKSAAALDAYEVLLRNPDKIELKFQIRGNLVVKKSSDRALLVVGRQAPQAS